MRSTIGQIIDFDFEVRRHVRTPCSCWLVVVSISLLLNLSASVVAKESAPSFDVSYESVSSESIVVKADGQTILSYRRAPNPFKPYLQMMPTPDGMQVLRDGVEDHVHHHGLMFAFSVEDADFWAENASDFNRVGGNETTCVGSQVPRPGGSARVKQSSFGSKVVINTRLDWLAAGTRRLLVEDREITLHPVSDSLDCSLLTWHSRLKTAPGLDSVKLWGTHFNGLGMRLATQMDDNGQIVAPDNASGEKIRGTEQLYSGPWCAYTSPFDDSHVTVVMFDHPKNERPVSWFVMTKPFAYLAATIGLDREPLILKRGDFVDLKYGIAFADGELSAKQIELLHQLWLQRIHFVG